MKFLKPFGTQNFVIGIGIAAATYLFGPTLKRNARRAAVKGMQGAMSAGGMASGAMGKSKDKMAGMAGMFQGMATEQQQPNQDVAMLYNELQEERKQISELASAVKSLQQEISDMKAEE
ncbi:hypothetical protein JCM16358_09410 [Halanaerocella petrolearia]